MKKFIKKLTNPNTIEAYGCKCDSPCYGCNKSCTTSNCRCSTFGPNIPAFADLTFNATSDTTGDVRTSSNPPEFSRYSK